MKKKKRESQSRRTSNTPVLVCAYGCIHRKLEAIVKKSTDDELFKARKYYNASIAIEISRYDQYRELRSSLSPTLKKLESDHDEANKRYHESHNLLGGPRDVTKADDTPEAKEVRRLKVIRNALWEKVKEERKKVEKQFFVEANEEFQRRRLKLLFEEGKKRGLYYDFDALSKEEISTAVKELKHVIGPHIRKHYPPIVRAQMLGEDWPDAWKEKECIEANSYIARKKACKDSGCAPGVYLMVDAAVGAALKTSEGRPKFKPFDHTGLVGIQVPKRDTKIDGKKISVDVTVKDAWSGTYPRLKLELLPEPSDENPGIKIYGYRRAERKFKEGKGYKKTPVLATIQLTKEEGSAIRIPFIMHRPLPEDGVIKWVMLHVTRIGTRYIYKLQFTCESKSFNQAPTGQGVIAIREGWRRLEDGSLQVAVTDDGENSIPLVLPAKMIQKNEYVKGLLRLSDQLFDGKRKKHEKVDIVVDIASGNRSVKASLSDWFKEDKKHLAIAQEALDEWCARRDYESKDVKDFHAWKAHGKMAFLTFALCEKYSTPERVKALWNKWKAERFKKNLDLFKENGDDGFILITEWLRKNGVHNSVEQVALWLEWWRRKDAHLVNMARGVQSHNTLHRRDFYRKFAFNLAKKYELIVYGEIDKEKIAKNPDPEDDTRNKREEYANALRQLCGVSILKEAIQHKFGESCFIKQLITKTEHYGCGGTIELHTEGDQHGICSKCGNRFDSDANIARQLWATYRDQNPSPSPKSAEKLHKGSSPPQRVRRDNGGRKRTSSKSETCMNTAS